MKKIVSVLTAAAIILCVSCVTQSFKTGTGTAEGYNGPIEVAVKISNGKLVDVSIVKITDTDSIGVPAANILAAEAVEKGTVENLDIVAGATISSKAVIKALQQAVAAARN